MFVIFILLLRYTDTDKTQHELSFHPRVSFAWTREDRLKRQYTCKTNHFVCKRLETSFFYDHRNHSNFYYLLYGTNLSKIAAKKMAEVRTR